MFVAGRTKTPQKKKKTDEKTSLPSFSTSKREDRTKRRESSTLPLPCPTTSFPKSRKSQDGDLGVFNVKVGKKGRLTQKNNGHLTVSAVSISDVADFNLLAPSGIVRCSRLLAGHCVFFNKRQNGKLTRQTKLKVNPLVIHFSNEAPAHSTVSSKRRAKVFSHTCFCQRTCSDSLGSGSIINSTQPIVSNSGFKATHSYNYCR